MGMFSLSNDSGKGGILPPLAALWFATVLGLGVLLLPEPVIDQVVPADAPFGLSARALAALLVAAAGALAGFAMARLVASRHRRALDSAGLVEPVIRPLNAREELDWPESEPPEPGAIPSGQSMGLPEGGADLSNLLYLIERLREAVEGARVSDADLHAALARLRRLRGAA